MSKEKLGIEVENMLSGLIEIVESECWNEIKRPFKYIITSITDYQIGEPWQWRKLRNKLNHKKKPISFEKVIERLKQIYDNLYDINLYVYYTNDKGTLIEIQYYPKSTISQKLQIDKPMLHAKVSIPYLEGEKEKFDINWEYNEGF